MCLFFGRAELLWFGKPYQEINVRVSYLTSQMKQFLLSSTLMLLFAVGITVSNSFDTNYLIQANVKSTNKAMHSKNVALTEKSSRKLEVSEIKSKAL